MSESAKDLGAGHSGGSPAKDSCLPYRRSGRQVQTAEGWQTEPEGRQVIDATSRGDREHPRARIPEAENVTYFG